MQPLVTLAPLPTSMNTLAPPEFNGILMSGDGSSMQLFRLYGAPRWIASVTTTGTDGRRWSTNLSGVMDDMGDFIEVPR